MALLAPTFPFSPRSVHPALQGLPDVRHASPIPYLLVASSPSGLAVNSSSSDCARTHVSARTHTAHALTYTHTSHELELARPRMAPQFPLSKRTRQKTEQACRLSLSLSLSRLLPTQPRPARAHSLSPSTLSLQLQLPILILNILVPNILPASLSSITNRESTTEQSPVIFSSSSARLAYR